MESCVCRYNQWLQEVNKHGDYTRVCDSFKKELLEGEHDFRSSGGDQFKLALYGSSASLSNTTTAYTTSQEVSASGTYSAGGGNLTSTGAAATNNTSFIDFSDISFTSAIYLSTSSCDI